MTGDMLMAGGEKVIIRLRDNSFGPASCENDRAGHSGQLIAELGNREAPEQEIRVYLDGKQLSDAVTKYQRRASRASGI